VRLLNVTVSIIEDDSPARTIFADWLNHSPGFKCLGQYGSAELAMPALLQERPNVILTDINLPGISGIECVRRLKPQLPDTQFVMLTVYEDADHIFEALAAGATGYLLKQTRRSALVEALREVNAGGSPMTSNIARKVVQSFQPTRPNDGEMLSPRESEVLDLLARGYLYKEIAESLGVSLPTVNTYIRRIYEKLHVRSRGQAVARYAHLAQRPSAPPAGKAAR
jgi:DNA-binding NarL/FixJ family response regulator